MSETTVESLPNERRFYLKELGLILIRPWQTFRALHAEDRATWLTPMLLLSLTLIGLALVTGRLRQQAAQMGEIELPPNFEFLTPEQQAQFFQTMELTSGPVFVYVLPSLGGLVALWIGWVIVSGALHLLLTLLGGRGESALTSNVVAWALLPFAVRDIVRAVAQLGSGRLIEAAGVSGFAPTDGAAAAFVTGLLVLVDLYLIWHVVLLFIGIRTGQPGLARLRVLLAVLGVVLAMMLAQAGLAWARATLGGLSVSGPFFFGF